MGDCYTNDPQWIRLNLLWDCLGFRMIVSGSQGGEWEDARAKTPSTRRRRKELTENEIGKLIIDGAIQVHRELGPGLLESVYEAILANELRRRQLLVKRQVPVAVEFRGIKFDEGFRADIVVENKVVIELKCVETIHRSHKKQLLTYLRLTDTKLGFLLNFSEALMRDGVTRLVNGLESEC